MGSNQSQDVVEPGQPPFSDRLLLLALFVNDHLGHPRQEWFGNVVVYDLQSGEHDVFLL